MSFINLSIATTTPVDLNKVPASWARPPLRFERLAWNGLPMVVATRRPTDPPGATRRPTDPPGATRPSADPFAPTRREGGPKRRFHVKPDPATGILHVKVWGFWDLEEAQAYVEEFRQQASVLLGKPWYVLANIADFQAQRSDVSAYVEQTMAFARANGMRKAANLVNSALSKMQISRLSADTGLPEYAFFTDESQAVAWLLADD